MIAVVQRVSQATVTVQSEGYHTAIGPGLVVLLAVEQGDGEADAQWMAAKLANLRIFADEQGKMNRSVREVSGEVLLVSQFTLAGDCSRGNRPSFVAAAEPALGQRLCEFVRDQLAGEHGLQVKTGIFGAMMQVALTNEGPVTLIVHRESDNATEK